jgi:hypothetical protein
VNGGHGAPYASSSAGLGRFRFHEEVFAQATCFSWLHGRHLAFAVGPMSSDICGQVAEMLSQRIDVGALVEPLSHFLAGL